MKKMSITLFLLSFCLLSFTITSTIVKASAVNAKAASSSGEVQIDKLNHTIKIQDGGLVIINDTLKLSPKPPETWVTLQNFSLGFPYKINDKITSSHLYYCFAYDTSNPDERFKVELDIGLGGRIGFYGVNVMFPEPSLNISKGGYNLTVIFVFSNLVSSETAALLKLDFPMYPSLTEKASVCNVTVVLPPDANRTDSNHGFSETTKWFLYPPGVGTQHYRQILNHTESPLEEFTSAPAWIQFQLEGVKEEVVDGTSIIWTPIPFSLIDCNEVKREITLDQWGSIHISDSYSITNRGYDISNVKVGLPEGAYDIAVRDEMGSIEKPTEEEAVTVNLREALHKDEAGKFFLSYRMPWETYISQCNALNYTLNFTFFERFNWTIVKLTVSITLPQGAEFQSSNPLDPQSIERSVLQETVTFAFSNVMPFEDLDFDLTYGYLVFWASFYPTVWMGVLIIIVSTIAFLWRAPKPPAVPIVPVPPEDVRSFVEAYNGKTRILSELESMEEKLLKGKILRRRYKVRKKMLEGRLSTLSRDLSNLGEKIRTAGAKYANIMRQIEVAETMLEGVETDIRRVEARYRRGEISKGAYGKLIEEYHHRRDKARTTIDGVLLRLREEIR